MRRVRHNVLLHKIVECHDDVTFLGAVATLKVQS